MTTANVVIRSVDGWPPHTQLWEVAGRHWLVCCIDLVATRDLVAEQWGLELSDTPGLKGHVEIFEATLTRTPVWTWEPDGEPTELPAGEVDHVIHGDTMTITVDGEPAATLHRRLEREDLHVEAIDADGDPLNHLTPRWVLPHGTTFEQAIDSIIQGMEGHDGEPTVG